MIYASLLLIGRTMGNCLALIVKKTELFVFPFPRIFNADPLRPPDPRFVIRILEKKELIPGQIQAVCRTGDLERARKLARTRKLAKFFQNVSTPLRKFWHRCNALSRKKVGGRIAL